MTLPSGSRLGPYDILGPLGAGGMGEVYRARDTRLNRDVAVKVLPPAFAQDSDRLRRFEQEAKAAAALNHPNVVGVFDVGLEGAVPYVVSELLEGEPLSSAVSRGPLPSRKAAELAVQIAMGMAAAHQKGIVHRDLKPANIFITAEGRAKILDFGLAKLVEPRESSTGSTELTTTPLPGWGEAPATNPGMVLGTAAYMSPEQVRGEPADHRSDIFAFGAVCYEMLSGHRAFTGDTAVTILAAILTQDPPELPAGAIPPSLERIVRRCLEKSPAQRFQSASDVAFALEAMSAPTDASALIAVARRRRRRALWAAAVTGGAAIGVLLARQMARTPAGVVSFEAKTFDRLPITNARFMPDGQTIVYSAATRGYAPSLFVLSPNAEAPLALDASDAHLLSVSSRGELALILDARHIGQRLYRGTLARMTMGSSARAFLEDVREADWSPDGAALAIVHDLGDGRDRLEYPVGTVRHEASGYLSDPRVSPDGRRVAFFEHPWRFDDRGRVKVVDQTGQVTTLAGEWFGLQGLAWTPDGSTLLFSGNATGGSVLQPMSVAASGRAAAQPALGVPGRFIVYDVARDGRWLGVREDLSLGVRAKVANEEAERDLSWLGSTGARGLSGDGQWLLMVDVGPRAGPDYGVVLRKTDGSQTIRLGAGSAQKLSPDGKWAAAITVAPAQVVLYPTGPGEAMRIADERIDHFISAEWFPDGRQLLVCGSDAARAPRCYRQDLAGSPPVAVTSEGVLASLAPDGRTLLLTLTAGGFQQASLEGGEARPVAGLRADDRHIAWSRDSQAVYVQPGAGVPATVEHVVLATGKRSVVGRLAPEGTSAVAYVSVADWVDDGRGYVYNYTSLPSTLFVVTRAVD